MQFWAIIVDSFRESRDRAIFKVMLLISAFVMVVMLSIGFQGDQIRLLFGMFELDAGPLSMQSDLGPDRLVGIMIYFVFNYYIGWFGVFLMIIATSDFFTSMIESGSIDVLVSKPISRPRLYLYKYLSAMIFALTQGAFFVIGTFLVMGLRWGVWRPGYLLAIPALVLLFSYLFCVTALVGVKTRSAIASFLITLAAWFGFFILQAAPVVFETQPSLRERTVTYGIVRVLGWIPPKTTDTALLVANWSGAPTRLEDIPAEGIDPENPIDPETARRIEEQQRSPLTSIGSSLVFETVIVLIGMWIFARRDY